jgi:hypothetical protein
MCLKEIGLHAPKMLTLIVNVFKGGRGTDLYDHLINTRIFTLIIKKIFA